MGLHLVVGFLQFLFARKGFPKKLSFTPIHKFAPQTGYFHYISRPGAGELFAETPTGRAKVTPLDTAFSTVASKITAPDVPFDKLL